MRFAIALAAAAAVYAVPRGAVAQRAPADSTMLVVRAPARGVRGVAFDDSIRGLASYQRLVPRGGRVTYGFAADTGYRKVTVLLDGQRIAPAGTITMNESHVLSVTSERVPRLVPQNQAMYDLIKKMMSASDPRPLSHSLLDEMDCAYDWYGGDRARQLHEDALQLLTSTPVAMQKYLKMAEKVGGDGYTPKCTKPRPNDATKPPPKWPTRP